MRLTPQVSAFISSAWEGNASADEHWLCDGVSVVPVHSLINRNHAHVACMRAPRLDGLRKPGHEIEQLWHSVQDIREVPIYEPKYRFGVGLHVCIGGEWFSHERLALLRLLTRATSYKIGSMPSAQREKPLPCLFGYRQQPTPSGFQREKRLFMLLAAEFGPNQTLVIDSTDGRAV